jgi:hypothetical protein
VKLLGAAVFSIFLSGHVHGQEFAPTDGLSNLWIQVADGCLELEPAAVDTLSETGGGNGMQRRMDLLIEDDKKFTATSRASLKCEAGFQLSGPDLKGEDLYCGPPGTNIGSVTVLDSNNLILTANELMSIDNTWGILFRFWQYELRGKVLIMKSPQNHCDDGQFKAYFIRAPIG